MGVQEAGSIKLLGVPEGIHGGAMIGVRGQGYIAFYDWANYKCARRIDVAVERVIWSDAGDMVALVTTSGFYILKYNREAVEAAFESNAPIDEDGVDDAFEVVNQV